MAAPVAAPVVKTARKPEKTPDAPRPRGGKGKRAP
jgi:hypothetical protein